jgi:hypothetical protein
MIRSRLASLVALCAPAASFACGAPAKSADPIVDAASDAGSKFPFALSNLTAAALSEVPSDQLIIGPTSCEGRVEVELDTELGTLPGCPALRAGIHYRYATTTQNDGSLVALFLTRGLRIEAGMRVLVRGRLPLIAVAQDGIDIAGTLGATALGSTPVAGGFAPPGGAKGNGTGPGAGQGDAPGGGGGGAHCGGGGRGGPAGNGGSNGGGPRNGSARIVPLAGGSSGGNGGHWEAGAGGGAIQLVAGRRIAILPTGVVHAGGGGGEREGGGGGSGGAILLEAPSVIVGGVLAVNGGGGGSGGEAGADATAGDQPARGGQAVFLNTGEGGNGAAGTTVDGGAGNPNPTFVNGDYSGGGGGGAGYLRINGTAIVTGTLSPALGTPCASLGVLE